MQQLTIFDSGNEFDEPQKDEILIIPRTGIIKNQVSIMYKGFHIANARDCGNGIFEVRPRSKYFTQRDLGIRKMNKNEIRDFSKKSFVHYEERI